MFPHFILSFLLLSLMRFAVNAQSQNAGISIPAEVSADGISWTKVNVPVRISSKGISWTRKGVSSAASGITWNRLRVPVEVSQDGEDWWQLQGQEGLELKGITWNRMQLPFAVEAQGITWARTAKSGKRENLSTLISLPVETSALGISWTRTQSLTVNTSGISWTRMRIPFEVTTDGVSWTKQPAEEQVGTFSNPSSETALKVRHGNGLKSEETDVTAEVSLMGITWSKGK
jgi:hypothetical protein